MNGICRHEKKKQLDWHSFLFLVIAHLSRTEATIWLAQWDHTDISAVFHRIYSLILLLNFSIQMLAAVLSYLSHSVVFGIFLESKCNVWFVLKFEETDVHKNAANKCSSIWAKPNITIHSLYSICCIDLERRRHIRKKQSTFVCSFDSKA